ncbi:MAG: ABC transporter ATP-binding protein [Candidatus Nitrohelix vancouverensis]|uniref:ABC transporter ATP-binding protein n=1 Tax=Candidatus Nitrohelix vancouverensis TaxID=2705534 RepID=A0A7T0C2R0_9BACT|nr:MAG: ABC transporter ATP-binding protein [Candidatus Nitrohelix vancouverensis]
MSKIVIKATELTKIYRLYTKPLYRFLDLLGFLQTNNGAYTEHKALESVNLEIRQGEKVAFIGRNGAGKSTLLKLFSRVIEPTSGSIEITEKVHALLTMGAGFHQDFTGRENVISYLAQLGVIGREAENRLEEIVEFAELEEYINQPVKTYSTGMGMRLMFATSTIITPDILVIDEVLGVGDAYFAKKSLERIKYLCEGQGTTLLLVTHDVYAASSLCDRFIWIDNGRIICDDSPKKVIDAYEYSIKTQEEDRLRRKRLRMTKQSLFNVQSNRASQILSKDSESSKTNASALYIQIKPEQGVNFESPVSFSSFELLQGERQFAFVDCGRPQHPSEDSESGLIFDKDESNWGEAYEKDGTGARDFLPVGAIANSISLMMVGAAEQENPADFALKIKSFDSYPAKFIVNVFPPNGQAIPLGTIDHSGTEQWRETRFPLDARIFTEFQSFETVKNKNFLHLGQEMKRVGTHDIMITSVDFIDQSNQSSDFFKTGDPLKVQFSFKVLNPDVKQKPIFVLTFFKMQSIKIMRLMHSESLIDGKEVSSGVVNFDCPKFSLGEGIYQVTAAIFNEGYFESSSGKFYTINEGVLDIHSRSYEINIQGHNNLEKDVILVHNYETEFSSILRNP